MKKIYFLFITLAFVNSSMHALRFLVNNKTKRDILVTLKDDKSASDRVNGKKIEHNGGASFTTTLTKKIKGPLQLAFVDEMKKGGTYTLYETPADAYFFPFTYKGSVARRVEIKKDKKRRGNHYKIRKTPASKAWVLAKPGKWIPLNEKKVTNKNW